MSELVLAAYDRTDTAEHVLGVLRAHSDELPIDLDSAAIVRVGSDGGYTVITTDRPGSGGSFWGVMWEAFFSLVFRVPGKASAYGANLGGLFGAIDRAGADAGFRARIRSALGPGTSGLAVVTPEPNAETVLNHVYLRPYVLLRTEVAFEQDGELAQELGGLPRVNGGRQSA